MFILKWNRMWASLQTFSHADRSKNLVGIRHAWAIRGDTVNSRQHLFLTFDTWCDVTFSPATLWRGHGTCYGLIKDPEMPSPYTVSTNEHCMIIFVHNGSFFYTEKLNSIILASRMNSRLFCEKVWWYFSSLSFCFSFSVQHLIYSPCRLSAIWETVVCCYGYAVFGWHWTEICKCTLFYWWHCFNDTVIIQ